MIQDVVYNYETEQVQSPTVDNSINKVWSINEWGRLHEIILGDPSGAFLPSMDDISQRNFDRLDEEELLKAIPTKMPRRVIEETHEDLEQLEKTLGELGIKVNRTEKLDLSHRSISPEWEADQESAVNIRDITLIHGDLCIDVASPTRGRFFEGYAVKELFLDYYKKRQYSGLLSPPRPRLSDETFDLSRECGINDLEPLFDAANCIRFGQDIIIDINNTANNSGADWLQSVLDTYYGKSVVTVHRVSLSPDHIDVVIVPLCEGCALINPEYVNVDDLPDFLRKWKLIEAPEMVPQGYLSKTSKASDWIGLNLLIVDGEEKTVVVEERQLPLINCLSRHGFRTIPLRWRHGRSWGGAFHCVSLDTHREGVL